MKQLVIGLFILLMMLSSNAFTNNIEKENTQKEIYKTIINNIESVVSLLENTDNYLESITNKLIKSRDIAVKSANGIYTGKDREEFNKACFNYIDDAIFIIEKACFNGLDILNDKSNNYKSEINIVIDIDL